MTKGDNMRNRKIIKINFFNATNKAKRERCYKALDAVAELLYEIKDDSDRYQGYHYLTRIQAIFDKYWLGQKVDG